MNPDIIPSTIPPDGEGRNGLHDPEWDLTIPAEVEHDYEGRWLAWDATTRQVLADGATLDDVVPFASQAQADGHLVWFHFVLPGDVELLGGS